MTHPDGTTDSLAPNYAQAVIVATARLGSLGRPQRIAVRGEVYRVFDENETITPEWVVVRTVEK